MRAYVDSDVLVWHLRGDPRGPRFLKRFSNGVREELWIGAAQRTEILFFARPSEITATLELLSHFKTQPVTEEIVDFGAALYRQWHASHNSDVNDCLLAATALVTGGKIYTLNAKHYPMPDLAVTRAW